MSTKKLKIFAVPPGPRGPSGMVPSVSVSYASTITVAANTMTTIGTLTGACTISLGTSEPGFDNEWGFTVTQGSTAKTVTLPNVKWGFGIAPAFEANTTTMCRLYYIGSNLCGEWVTV